MKWRVFQTVIHLISHYFLRNSKVSETASNGFSVILVKLEYHRSDASPEMTCSGKHQAFRGMFSKVLKLIPNCSKWSKYTCKSLWRLDRVDLILRGRNRLYNYWESYMESVLNSMLSKLCFIRTISWTICKSLESEHSVFSRTCHHRWTIFKDFK